MIYYHVVTLCQPWRGLRSPSDPRHVGAVEQTDQACHLPDAISVAPLDSSGKVTGKAEHPAIGGIDGDHGGGSFGTVVLALGPGSRSNRVHESLVALRSDLISGACACLLGSRHPGSQEVRGSIPRRSTTQAAEMVAFFVCA